MADLLLVNAPTLYWAKTMGLQGQRSYKELIIRANGGLQNCRFYPLEYLGLLSIKAYCEQQGIQVDYINGISQSHRSTVDTIEAIKTSARDSGAPKLIGFTGANLVFEENEWLAIECKKIWPDVKIVLGHDFASLNYERVLREHSAIDFVIRGEGEIAFAKLCENISNRSVQFENIPGLAWRAEKKIKSNPLVTCNLDELPDVSRVELTQLIAEGHCGAIFTTRGCPFRCTFCTTGQVSELTPGKTGYRLRSMDRVLDEVKRLYRDHHLKTLNVVDDLFFTKSDLSKARAEEFARGLINSKLDIEFMFDCRVDSIDLDLFKLMKEAGLREIFVGVETGNTEQREKYNKKFAASIDPAELLDQVTQMGIKVVPGIITYHPDVTIRELKDTLNLITRLGPQRFSVFHNKMKAYPGTPLYDEYRMKGLLKTEWPVPDYDFRDPRIEMIYREIISLTAQPETTLQMVQHRMEELLA